MLRVSNTVTAEDSEWKRVQGLIESYEELLEIILDDNIVRENFDFIFDRGPGKTISATYQQWENLADLAKKYELVVNWTGGGNPFACDLYKALKGKRIS